MKNVLEILPDDRYARGEELLDKLADVCVGVNVTDMQGAAYNLLLDATMQAKECDELEAVEDIIQVSYELIGWLEDIEGGEAAKN